MYNEFLIYWTIDFFLLLKIRRNSFLWIEEASHSITILLFLLLLLFLKIGDWQSNNALVYCKAKSGFFCDVSENSRFFSKFMFYLIKYSFSLYNTLLFIIALTPSFLTVLLQIQTSFFFYSPICSRKLLLIIERENKKKHKKKKIKKYYF